MTTLHCLQGITKYKYRIKLCLLKHQNCFFERSAINIKRTNFPISIIDYSVIMGSLSWLSFDDYIQLHLQINWTFISHPLPIWPKRLSCFPLDWVDLPFSGPSSSRASLEPLSGVWPKRSCTRLEPSPSCICSR